MPIERSLPRVGRLMLAQMFDASGHEPKPLLFELIYALTTHAEQHRGIRLI